MSESGFLAGIRVLERGDGDAGGIAAATLALLGAEVVRVPGREPRSAGSMRALLDVDKRIAPHSGDVGTYDIVIDDLIEGVDPEKCVERVGRANRSVWVTITPFGLTGPDADRLGGELIALASSGVLSTIHASDGETPVLPPVGMGSRLVGQAAALAALHGLDQWIGSDVPVHVDVSAQEAAIGIGALPECAHAIFRCPGRAGSGRYVAPSGVFPCRDGLVRVAAIENHQWTGMVECLGAPEWTVGLKTREARAEHAAMINAHVAEWTATQDKAACADLLQGRGVPATAVNGPLDLLHSAQYAARGFFRDVDVYEVAVSVPSSPWVSAVGERAADVPRRGRVAGLPVVELTHVLAGPIVGALLGGMGADVVRVEDASRLDIYRRTGPFAAGVAGVERGAYFAVANHSKRSVAVDSEEIGNVLADLLDRSCVFIENVGVKRLAKLGVDLEARARERAMLTASVSGFGNTGPLAGYRVYANNVHAYGGLAYLTRDADGAPARLGTVLADPLSAVTAATVIAAWALGPERDRGATVDLSMAEVVTTTIGAFVVAASTSADEPAHDTAPYGIYPADGGWIAIAVESDDEWQRLLGALGRPDALLRSEWTTAAGRLAARDDVDGALRECTERVPIADLGDDLRRANVRAGRVLDAQQLLDDPHLAARGFFPTFVHPDADLDDARLVGLPWRFVGAGPIVLAPPPALGSANADLLERHRA